MILDFSARHEDDRRGDELGPAAPERRPVPGRATRFDASMNWAIARFGRVHAWELTMEPLARFLADLQRRVGMLPDDLTALANDANNNVQGWGLHASQLAALQLMMADLTKRQTDLIGQLDVASLPAFGETYNKLQYEMLGAQELWRLFRYIFAQRLDKSLKPPIDLAELVAYDCYRCCLDRARAWGLVKDDQMRTPPLVYLDAKISPATNMRGQTFGFATLPIEQFANMQLPIPLIYLPFDHVRCVWLLCSLHHEVGHDVDKDLGLVDELKAKLTAAQKIAAVPDDRQVVWQVCAGEVLADVFGVLLGGAGYAHAMAPLFLALAPKYMSKPSPSDDHPNPWVRIPLLVTLLRKAKVPALTRAADLIEPSWKAANRPAWLGPYVEDCDLVADLFLDKPLDVLREKKEGAKTHSVRDLVPNPTEAADFAARLGTYLSTQFDKPVTGQPANFPWRLVPAAAQLVIAQPEPDGQAITLDELQKRTMQYQSEIPKPNKLAVAPDRAEFYHQLIANNLKFDPPSGPVSEG